MIKVSNRFNSFLNLQEKLRRSEEDEMQRIIGQELIQKCEDLRDEYNNFFEIYQDMMMEKQESEAKIQMQEKLKKSSGLFSTGGN